MGQRFRKEDRKEGCREEKESSKEIGREIGKESSKESGKESGKEEKVDLTVIAARQLCADARQLLCSRAPTFAAVHQRLN
jgi:hypothetical protein